MINRTIALIPAYEPTETLIHLVKKLYVSNIQIVIIDDGSGPDYHNIFKQAKQYATVLSYAENRGKGAALKTGLSYIKNHYDKNCIIVTMDSDGQHTVEDALNVAQIASKNLFGLTLGVRAFGDGTPIRSRFGNSITRFVYRMSTGISVSDTQTGLRAFGYQLIPFLLDVSGTRYEYEMNVLLECPKKKIKILEEPIETIYYDKNKSSHFSTIKDSFRVYKNILKFTASSLIGFATDYGLYSVLVIVTSGLGAAISIPLSNISARVVSSFVNYAINRRLVFDNKESALKTGIQYFTLAAFILLLNTMLLNYLVNSIGMNKYTAKILTEVTFFIMSWIIQRFVIFRKKATGNKKILEKKGSEFVKQSKTVSAVRGARS